jgi:hypothetical protein
VPQMGEKRNVYRLLIGKPEGKRPLERRRCRCRWALVLSIAYLNVLIMAYLSIHRLRIFVLINPLFMFVSYVYCSSTHALPINLLLSNLEGFILSFSNS